MSATSKSNTPRVKVLTDIHSLSDFSTNDLIISVIPLPKGKSRLVNAVKSFMASFSCDYILLNFSPLELLLLAFFKILIPVNRARLVSLDLILTVPTNARDHVMHPLKVMLLKKVYRFLMYFRNTTGYQKLYRINPGKFTYIPFKINSIELVLKQQISDQGYIFCGGKSRRDFSTLFKAVEGQPVSVRVVTPTNDRIAEHGSFLDSSQLPANVQVVHDDGTPQSFLNHMAAARMVVLPIKKNNMSASGLGVYICAMALKKCVIISAGPGVDDNLTGEQAIIVPPEDPVALRLAILRATQDDELRNLVAENGYRYAMSLGGMKQLVASIALWLASDYAQKVTLNSNLKQ